MVCVRKCRKRCVRIKNRMEIQRSGSNNLDRSGDHCIFYRNRSRKRTGKRNYTSAVPYLQRYAVNSQSRWYSTSTTCRYG